MKLSTYFDLGEFIQLCLIRELYRVTKNYERGNLPGLFFYQLDVFCEMGCTVTRVMRKSVSFRRQTEESIVSSIFLRTRSWHVTRSNQGKDIFFRV